MPRDPRVGEAADERSQSLLRYGAWSDLKSVPCECCGTPLTIIEQTAEPARTRLLAVLDLLGESREVRLRAAIGATTRQWVELVRLSVDEEIADVVIQQHDPVHCRFLRDRGADP
jgi:hypothetical protein